MRATGIAVLELGERCTAVAVALLAAPGLSTAERLLLQAVLDQLQAALRNLHASAEVPHRGPSCAGHPPLAADPPWSNASARHLEATR